MKQIWFSVCLLTGSLLYSSIAPAQPTASGALLQQMSSASRSLNYELAYISISKQGIESLRYRHAVIGNVPLGQLLHMDGPRREVLQRGGGISYFEPGLEPFTLTGDHIVDALPAIVYADFTRLAKYYDFISVGSTRIADRPCEVLRVVARDGSRYSYIVWMDEDTKLPLRVDLLDRDGETLEQYRVISFAVGADVQGAMQGLLKANLPPLLSLPAVENVQLSWSTGWLPAGVEQSPQIAKRRRAGRIPALQRRSVQLLGQRQPGGQRSRAAILPSGAPHHSDRSARGQRNHYRGRIAAGYGQAHRRQHFFQGIAVMMKEWATVVSWQQGVALLRCEPKAGCGSCTARSGCGARALNELVPETEHQLQVHIDQPLEPGQRVEVGIAEGSLLRSAMLVYLTPLLGMMLGGTLLQYCFGSDASAAVGAVLGGGAAFMLARRLARRLGEQADYQPVVLQIGLPPTAMRMQAENSPLI